MASTASPEYVPAALGDVSDPLEDIPTPPRDTHDSPEDFPTPPRDTQSPSEDILDPPTDAPHPAGEAPTPPSTSKRRIKRLSRDQRISIQTLRNVGWTYARIATEYKLTHRAVQYACTHPPTPSKRSGRPTLLSEEQADTLVAFLTASEQNRRYPYKILPALLGFECSETTIRHVLRKRGFKRYPGPNKPPISETNRQERLVWATEHLGWTKEQWNHILWSGETWISEGPHQKISVTKQRKRPSEPTQLTEKPPTKTGLTFWSCFAGSEKGPHLFWEKEWGPVTKDTYQEHITPLVDGWLRYVCFPILKTISNRIE